MADLNSQGRTKRIALVTPSSNTVLENDLHAALPKSRFTVHTARMYLVETTREAEIRMIEDHASKAASDLGTLKPDLLVFGCTSAGSLFGLDYDKSVCQNLGGLAGCPSLGVINAVESALKRANARRVAVLTPYNEDLTQSVARAISDGREIVGAFGMGITDNVKLADPTPKEIYQFGEEKLRDLDFDTIFISCTNFRAYEALSLFQARFRVPVVTSNQAVIEEIRQIFAG
jgi:maleate isomerase